MSYADLLDDEGINAQFLAVLSPRRKVTSWTLEAGSVYKNTFTYGQVSGVAQNGVALAEGSSAILSAGQFFYDPTTTILYVRMSDSSNPSTKFVVATYELYVATLDAHWYRDPLDSAKRVVYYEPVITRSPQLKQSLTDALFGFLPTQASTITLNNAEHFLEPHVYDSSFNRATIKVYHWLGDLEIGNLKLVYNGLMGDVSYDDSSVSIRTLDRVDQFAKAYRNVNESFYSTSLFPNLDPFQKVVPIRYVYGMVDGFRPVNVDYAEVPSLTDNRNWAVMGEQANLANITGTVAGSPASTATRTYLTSAVGMNVGDSVWMDRAVGVDEYKKITVVNYTGSQYIEHTALSGGAMASGDQVKRGFIGAVFVIKDDIIYEAMYTRDFTVNGGMAGGTSGFTFVDNFEANLSIPSPLAPTDVVACRVYGRKNDLTISAVPAFGNDTLLGNLTSPAAILYDLLKKLGLPESEINTSSFTALHASNTEALGFAVPAVKSSAFPSFKTLVTDVMGSSLYRIFIDNDQKWKLTKVAPFSVETKEVASDEILEGSFAYGFRYTDVLSDVIVEYKFVEQPQRVGLVDEDVSKALATSENAMYLHGVSKERTFKSLHFRDADAATLASRIRYLLGDRIADIEFLVKGRFFDTLIDDKIKIVRAKLPGFSFDEETDRERVVATLEFEKGLRQIRISLDDFKGMNDNSGSWV